MERLLLVVVAAWGMLLHSALASSDEGYPTTVDESTYSYRLPRVHIQFICHQDIRAKFSVVEMFDTYYRGILPGLSNTTLAHDFKTSSMRDIPPQKWYYSSCNISSPQVLLTMETEGWAKYYHDWNGTDSSEPYQDEDAFQAYIMEHVTSTSLEDFTKENVCSDMEIYRSIVEDWSNKTAESFEHDAYLDHSLILLCGGENYIYYDDGDADSGFFLFGMIVGLVMVSMIWTELQKFSQQQPSRRRDSSTTTSSSSGRRSSRRRDRQRVDYALTPTEIEMV